MPYIELKDVKKEYQMGEVKITALAGVNFSVEKGELVVVLGPSGAGKTTVLNILGGMDTCDSGHILVDGNDISKYSRRKLVEYRRFDIGFVFQFYNLVQNLTALENVELASQICKNPLDPVKVMDQVGLKGRLKNFPAQLSGGEQQRVAIARAIAKNPTGALDSKTGKKILELLQKTSHEMGMTTIIITHNAMIAEIADRVVRMKNGKIIEETLNDHPLPVSEIDW